MDADLSRPRSFKLYGDMLYGFKFVIIKIQGFSDDGIAFYQFACGKVKRDVGFFCMIFNEVSCGVKTSVYGSAMVILSAKIVP